MKKNVRQIALAVLATVSSLATSAAEVTTQFKLHQSPNNLTEQCALLPHLQLGDYKPKDLKAETELCELDFYNNTVALCPKTWSTSPGTIVGDLKGTGKTSAQAEASSCQKGVLDSAAKFKQTMNQSGTSGTFSGSSILYYHFSRALDTAVTVPVAVYRTMDKAEHYSRVTSKARPAASAKMNVAGWQWMVKAEKNSASYSPAKDILTSDMNQIYGVLLDGGGERYGFEINGTRKSGWGKGQNFDFQKTPAFLALKTQGDLETAIAQGYREAVKDGLMGSAFKSGAPSKEQMVLWMNEVSEIAILDYIFSQQDRVGNIDYEWYWSYVDAAGEVQATKVDSKYQSKGRNSMNDIPVPAEIKDFKPVLVQKTQLGDNDAGGMNSYANFTKATGMLDGVSGMSKPIAHLNGETYQRLQKLAADFSAKGENYDNLNENYRIIGLLDSGDKRFNQMINNTILAADLLKKNCQAGILKLDLVSFKQAMKGDLTADAVSCD